MIVRKQDRKLLARARCLCAFELYQLRSADNRKLLKAIIV